MGLVTIYYNSDNEYGYIKAIVREEDIPFFERLGVVYRNQADIPKEMKTTENEVVTEILKSDPDKGFGVVGSYEWHTNQIKSMETKTEVINYTKDITGKKIRSTAKNLIAIKVKALETIKEFMDDDKNK